MKNIRHIYNKSSFDNFGGITLVWSYDSDGGLEYQASFCSEKDQYCRKEGVERALISDVRGWIDSWFGDKEEHILILEHILEKGIFPTKFHEEFIRNYLLRNLYNNFVKENLRIQCIGVNMETSNFLW